MFGFSSDTFLKYEIASSGIVAAKRQMHGIHYPFHIKISTGSLAIPDTTPRHCAPTIVFAATEKSRYPAY